MELRLRKAIRKSEDLYTGYVNLSELAEVFKSYPFDAEVAEKARIQKAYMTQDIPSFSVTIRVNPDSDVREEEGDMVFQCTEGEIRDGKSKTAAVCMMEARYLEGKAAMVSLFLVTKEKMDKLEQNKR